MFIQSGGVQLSCELEIHSDDAPLAVILHGITGNKQERHIVGAADALSRAGFGTLRVDLFGHGESGRSFSEHTIPKWVRNALDVLDHACTVSNRVLLCGHSQGGLTAMLAGEERREKLSGLILLSPAWSIPDGARKGDLLGMRFDPGQVPERLELPNKGVSVGREYVQTAQSIRIGKPAFSGPVLIIHGEADQTVPVSWSKELVRRYRNAGLVTIPGDTHCYDHHLDTVREAVSAWVTETIHGSEANKSNQS